MSCPYCHGPHDWDTPCPPVPREPPSRAFPAQFDSRCGFCRGPIAEGDSIVMSEGRSLHEDCQ